MYKTYYVQSSGQPRNGESEHTTAAAALDAWQSDCGALFGGSGGRAVLVQMEADEDGPAGAELIWLEHCEGAYLTGDLAEGLVECGKLDAEQLESPAQVAAQLRNYW